MKPDGTRSPFVAVWPRPGRETALHAAALILGAISLFGVLRALLSLDLHVSFDPNEGWNGYHAADAITGGALYPPTDSFVFNNYPPLSFYVEGALGLLTGDNIVAGRWIALCAFLFTAAAIAQVARALGTGWKAGLFGAFFFTANIAFDTNRVGINDLQMLGHALGTAGLWLALKGPHASGRIAGAALLLSLAFFTKHNLIAQPVALFLWLALTDRRAAGTLAAAGLAFTAAGAAFFQIFYGFSLWSRLDSARLFSWSDSGKALLGWLKVCGLPIAAFLAVLALHPRDRAGLFCLIYLIVSLAVGVYFEGGAGTISSVLFDNMIALGLCASVGWQILWQGPHGRLAAVFAGSFVLVVLGMLGVRAAEDDFYPRYWLERQHAVVAATSRTIERIRAQPGPVLCSDLALCYWAGKKAEWDAFGFRQAVLTGARDGKDLESAIAARRYALIVGDVDDANLWTERIATAVKAHYRIADASLAGTIWVPR